MESKETYVSRGKGERPLHEGSRQSMKRCRRTCDSREGEAKIRTTKCAHQLEGSSSLGLRPWRNPKSALQSGCRIRKTLSDCTGVSHVWEGCEWFVTTEAAKPGAQVRATIQSTCWQMLGFPPLKDQKLSRPTSLHTRSIRINEAKVLLFIARPLRRLSLACWAYLPLRGEQAQIIVIVIRRL